MKQTLYLILFCITFSSCEAQPEPVQFSAEALNDTFIDSEENEVMFKSIIEAHKGKTVLIDIWASWCRDCIEGFPKLKALQKDNPEIVYLFLSLDKSQDAWKRGIKKHNLEGAHYFMASGWEGDFATFVDLDWIPRYIIVDADGNIKMFRAIKVDDEQMQKSLDL